MTDHQNKLAEAMLTIDQATRRIAAEQYLDLLQTPKLLAMRATAAQNYAAILVTTWITNQRLVNNAA
jgi:hypothetical protein